MTDNSRWVSGSRMSVRARLLIGMLLLASLTLMIAGTVNYVVERKSIETRLDDDLQRDVEEIRVLADTGFDPDTQEHFTQAKDLMYAAMQYNQMSATESMVSVHESSIIWTAPQHVDLRLEDDPEFVAWAKQLEPTSAYITTVTTDQRTYRTAVTPILLAQDSKPGIYLQAYDFTAVLRDLRYSLAIYLGAGVGALILGGIVAWLLVGRVMQPIRDLQETAQRITDQDLDYRIQARGHDEFAQLTETINTMLDRLQNALEEQRQLLDDVGHELRTPITIIRGHLELMDPLDPEDVRQSREIGLDELDRMSLLVNDLVTLAQSNRPDFIQPVDTDITELVHHIAAKASALGEREWILQVNAHGTVSIDANRITQAMLQLCANAVKYSEPGSLVELGSAIRRTPQDTDELLLWVADNGIGITPEDQEQIFVRFGRGGNGDRAQGSGLGLNIVSAIATAHDGEIRVESAPGSGSIFILSLPLNQQQQYTISGDVPATLEAPRVNDQEFGQ